MPSRTGSYGSRARVLSVGIALTGLVTFAYFALASHALDGDVRYKQITLLWSILLATVSVIYRPVEQLLSRAIAERRSLRLDHHPLRTPALIQAAFGSGFLVAALAARGPLTDLLGSSGLYWVLVVAAVAYACSYFARGWLAGHERFGLYGSLVFCESCSRCLFALAAVVGIASGQLVVALGMAAAPVFSLLVVPLAFAGRTRGSRSSAATTPAARPGGASLRQEGGFALGVLAIMLAEQLLLNGAVITVDLTSSDAILAGIVFNVLLIVRAPLTLFQAIQTTLLPHLTGLHATAGERDFDQLVRTTVMLIAAFTGIVVAGLLLLGPFAMGKLFGGSAEYGRLGLALVGVGMGFHLAAGALNQSALARRRSRAAAFAWLTAAALFLAWTITPLVGDQLLRVELGYPGATILLAGLLLVLHRQGR